MPGLLDDPYSLYNPAAIRQQSLYQGLMPLGLGLAGAGASYLPLQNPNARMQSLMQGAQGFSQGQQGYTKDALSNAQTQLAVAKAKKEDQQDTAWKAMWTGGLMDNPTPDSLLTPGIRTAGATGTPDSPLSQMPDPSQPIPPNVGTPANSYQQTGMPVADAMGTRLTAAGVAPNANRFNPQGTSPLSQLPPGMAKAIYTLGPEKGSAVLASVLGKQMETGQWSESEKGGVKGQINRTTGEFKPFNPTFQGAWQPEDRKGVPGQINTLSGEWKPLDPTQTKVAMNLAMPPQETAESKKVGEFMGETYNDLQKSALDAPKKKASLDRLENLLTKPYTGPGGEAANTFNRGLYGAGKAAGFDVSGLEEKIGSAEAAKALAGQMALELRNPAGGAGMPGAMSDADREFLKSMVPALATTPEGRAMTLETKRRLIDRDAAVAKIARDYRKKNGHVDEGLFEELQNYSDKNPLFNDLSKKIPAATSAADPLGIR